MTTSAWLDKRRLQGALLELLERDLEKLQQSQKITQSAATHEESRPENDKDTRALESSYLARGQARRVQELQGDLARLKAMESRAFEGTTAIALSAVVELGSGEGSITCWLVPAGAGTRVVIDGLEVRMVTPQSPLGRGLLGKAQGDTFEVQTPQGVQEYDVTRVC